MDNCQTEVLMRVDVKLPVELFDMLERRAKIDDESLGRWIALRVAEALDFPTERIPPTRKPGRPRIRPNGNVPRGTSGQDAPPAAPAHAEAV